MDLFTQKTDFVKVPGFKERTILYVEGAWTMSTIKQCGDILNNSISNPKHQKILFSLFTELSLNILLHSLKKRRLDEGRDFGEGLLQLVEFENHYRFVTKNIVTIDELAYIQERCEIINGLDKQEIREYFRDERKKSAETNYSGGNLGLIDLVRKSGNPISIESEIISQESSELKIEIIVDK